MVVRLENYSGIPNTVTSISFLTSLVRVRSPKHECRDMRYTSYVDLNGGIPFQFYIDYYCATQCPKSEHSWLGVTHQAFVPTLPGVCVAVLEKLTHSQRSGRVPIPACLAAFTVCKMASEKDWTHDTSGRISSRLYLISMFSK